MQTFPQLIEAHLEQHQSPRGVWWPNEPQFQVVYCMSTWPIGFQGESSIEFFRNQAELDQWIAKMAKWSKLEDNHITYRVYEWDWGPQRRDDLSNEWHSLPLRIGYVRPLN